MNKKTLAAMVAALLECGAAQASGNLITNGGFEKPVVPVGGLTSFPVGGNFPGWKVVGQPQGVEIVSTTYHGAFSNNWDAHSGQQSIELVAQCGIAQTVPLTIGQSYTIKYWVGNLYVPDHYGSSARVDLLLDGVLVQSSFSFQDSGDLTIAWKSFSYTFVATDVQASVAFLGGTPPGGAGYFAELDDVSIVPAADN